MSANIDSLEFSFHNLISHFFLSCYEQIRDYKFNAIFILSAKIDTLRTLLVDIVEHSCQ